MPRKAGSSRARTRKSASARLACHIDGCTRTFPNRSGLTQHLHRSHPQRHRQPQAASPAPEDANRVTHSSVDDLADVAFADLGLGDSDVHPLVGQSEAEEDYNEARTGWVEGGYRKAHQLVDDESEEECRQRWKRGPHRDFHPFMNAIPCDEQGNDLPQGAHPLPQVGSTTASPGDAEDHKWAPYGDKTRFSLAEFLFQKVEMSQPDINELLDLWSADLERAVSEFASSHDCEYDPDQDAPAPPFVHYQDLHETIDATQLADIPWQCMETAFPGDVPADAPTWKCATHTIWYRDPAEVVKNILGNEDFKDEFDFTPYTEYDATGERHLRDFFSGNWAWRQCDTISSDPDTRGSMFVPIILGSDKTTVSVATGNNEYWPVYLSIGNVRNSVRRAHRNAVVPIAFLSIPKSDRKYDNNAEFRLFRQQLFHSSLSAVLQPLKEGMTRPQVVRCCDGHWRRAIYGLGPYIADYPEQVLLSGIVQGWCPRCTALPDDLDGGDAGDRDQTLTDELIKLLDSDCLWREFGINDGIVPFTYDFPRADIHELISMDLLHQLIKGTFKDHLVEWVCEYIRRKHTPKRAKEILDDIDRKIAAAPSFPGLRRFPHGRRFKQWTGDDSKALMKVYIPAIREHVESDVLRCLTAFLDFTYIARRSDLNTRSLIELDDALTRFHKYREVFRRAGVHDTLSLPRQHSMVHYREMIEDFGAPNGLCTSITENRHITAVKKPWRRSSRYKALGQMLLTNTRLDKLNAARSSFVASGLLEPKRRKGYLDEDERGDDGDDTDDDEEGAVDEAAQFQGTVSLPRQPQPGYPSSPDDLAVHIHQNDLPLLIRRFLYDQLHPTRTSSHASLEDLPPAPHHLDVFHSAAAKFYAPSDVSGTKGMRKEYIRSTPSWRKEGPRRDAVFAVKDKGETGMRGLYVLRVILLFSFDCDGGSVPCALVEWFSPVYDVPDPETGMWIVEAALLRSGKRERTVVHLNTLIRCAHLLPVFDEEPLPFAFHHTYTLDCFRTFFVNKFADHHAHEIAF
ncbi:hypothetical protein BD626DRAFT_430192 [Schizophyllum amplum]|uniref:C2H2-type domain-containing protein n=1 Tax=Schizophyllum amplum TaxID=97359 RepID=A0A550CI07_9AGAR|nr:hypothetical protein BD626DRAFT_430192 [Auriculariopsis ampla]